MDWWGLPRANRGDWFEFDPTLVEIRQRFTGGCLWGVFKSLVLAVRIKGEHFPTVKDFTQGATDSTVNSVEDVAETF